MDCAHVSRLNKEVQICLTEDRQSLKEKKKLPRRWDIYLNIDVILILIHLNKMRVILEEVIEHIGREAFALRGQECEHIIPPPSPWGGSASGNTVRLCCDLSRSKTQTRSWSCKPLWMEFKTMVSTSNYRAIFVRLQTSPIYFSYTPPPRVL